jgi:hypothetical protein
VTIVEVYTIEKRCLIANVDEKENINLYTLLDVGTFDKTVGIGVKIDKPIPEMSVATVKMTLKTDRKRVVDNGNTEWLEVVVSKFIDSIELDEAK